MSTCMAPWEPGGTMSHLVPTRNGRAAPRASRTGGSCATPTISSCSSAATSADVQDLREEIAIVLEPLGLRLSEAKTQIVHMSEGFDFLGFHIQWRRKRGTNKWYVYTFIAKRPIRSVKDKIRALTPRTSQQDLRAVLIRLNQIMRGWSNYFKHAVAQHTFSHLQQLHLVADRADDANPASLEVEGRPSLAHRPHRPVETDQRRTGSNCSTSQRYRSPDTATAATRSPTPGPAA